MAVTHTQRDQEAVDRGKQARELGARRLWQAIEARRRSGPLQLIRGGDEPIEAPHRAERDLRSV